MYSLESEIRLVFRPFREDKRRKNPETIAASGFFWYTIRDSNPGPTD
jgi:hypothetical protein